MVTGFGKRYVRDTAAAKQSVGHSWRSSLCVSRCLCLSHNLTYPTPPHPSSHSTSTLHHLILHPLAKRKLTFHRGLHVGALHAFSKRTYPPLISTCPYNPLPLILTFGTLLISSIAVVVLWSSILPIIQSRFLWGAGSILAILTFTSGHMWNRIKNAPYVAQTQGGGVSWVAGGFQNQLGMESQVVAGLCELFSFSVRQAYRPVERLAKWIIH